MVWKSLCREHRCYLHSIARGSTEQTNRSAFHWYIYAPFISLPFCFVLVSAGMELIFFIVACRVLCFGLVTKTGLITHQCFICYWTVLAQHQGLLRFSSCCTSKQAGGAQVAGRGHSKAAGHTGTPYHMVSCSATKANVVFPKETLLSDWLGISQLVASYCFCITSFSSSVPTLRLSLPWPTSFLTSNGLWV